MKNISTKIEEIKKLNYKIKMIKSLELDSKQLSRICDLLFIKNEDKDGIIRERKY